VLPLQHPAGQETASQTHWPVVMLHSCPAAHVPHAAPPVPHELADSDAYCWHAPAAVQQPLGHEVESQTHAPVPSHSRPDTHALHAAPALPHDVLLSLEGCSQVPLAVQQPGHDVPAHVHAPAAHASPLPHAAQAAPPRPHSVPVCMT
jgi:hypothetical protein